MVVMAYGRLFHSMGASTVKLHIPMCLLDVIEETERWLPCVRSVCSIKDDRY